MGGKIKYLVLGQGTWKGITKKERNQMREHRKCSSRIVNLTRSLGGHIKSAIESMSLELRNGDRNLGIMR